MKVISKHAKETENMSLKTAFYLANGYRMHVAVIKTRIYLNNLTKWVHKECKIVKQTMYNYISFYKLMCIAAVE